MISKYHGQGCVLTACKPIPYLLASALMTQEECHTIQRQDLAPGNCTPPYDTCEYLDADDSAKGLTVASVVVGVVSQDQDKL